MSMEITATCDAKNCRSRIYYNDECYCRDCYEDLLKTIEELEKKLEEMELSHD